MRRVAAFAVAVAACIPAVAFAAGGQFTDDENTFYEASANAIYADGITAGCNATNTLYCGDQPVTRGQMAVFIAQAVGLNGNDGVATLTAGSFRYATPVTRADDVHAVEFMRTAPAGPGTGLIAESAPLVYWHAGLVGEQFIAPVELPTGATTAGLRCWVYDANAGEDLTVLLQRRHVPNNAVHTIATITSAGTDPAAREFVATGAEAVDAAGSLYELVLSGSNVNLGLLGCEVSYTTSQV